MTASRTPSAPSRRPWYLTAALIASWIYGAQGMSDGWESLAFYRGDRVDIHAYTDSITNPAVRSIAVEAGERWLEMRDAAKKREMPIGAASLLLGTVMVICAFRSMAGREGARSTLIQVVLVYAGVVVVGFFLTSGVARAEVEFHLRLSEGIGRGYGDPAAAERAHQLMPTLVRVLSPVVVAMRTIFSALIVLALTRPRVRAFFREAAPGPLGEG